MTSVPLPLQYSIRINELRRKYEGVKNKNKLRCI
jgi:hypothetical protein